MKETNTLGLILAFLGVCVVNGAAVAVVWLQGRARANQTDAEIRKVGVDAKAGSSSAAEAAEFAKPVSNGFTTEMRQGLAALLAGQQDLGAELTEIRTKLDKHIGDHASADVLRPR